MKLDIRAKLVLVSLAPIAAAVLIVEAYLRPLVEGWIVEDTRAHLFAQLALIERTVVHEAPDGKARRPEWDELADDLGQRIAMRVSFIAADGRVLGDSEVERAALGQVENHRDRFEVAAALRGEIGFSQRWSATVERHLVYAARPVSGSRSDVAVIRVAQPLESVERAIRRLHRAMLIGAFLALATALAMSTVAAQLMSRALRGVTAAARRMAAGNLHVRTGIGGKDEVGGLARALDGLAENLSSTMAALQGERDLLGRILESMQEGVLVLDGEGRIALVNSALGKRLRIGGEVVGRTPLEAIRNAELQAILDEAVRKRAASGEIEVDGFARTQFMVHATAISGEPGGVVAVLVDVTDIRRLESIRKDFVANVSHELRTPVTAVRSAVETLRHALPHDPDSAARFIDMIDRNAERLGALIEDLLDLSRIESREYRPDIQKVSLGSVVDRVLGLLQVKADEKRQRLASEVPSELPELRADARAVEQVLTNLVENAMKYSGEGDAIRIAARVAGQRVRVEVVDHGPGIEARHLPRLFERFYRVDSGRSRQMGGTGLGLSIVKHLVEAMGGAVGVESAPGKGSTFWFALPAATSPPLSPPPP